MKKVLVLLFACLTAVSSLSAAVDFSGELKAGYIFNYDNSGSGEWETGIMGQDGDDTNITYLTLSIADEDGLWSVGIEGTPTLDDSGAVSGDITLDLAKIIAGGDTRWSAEFGLLANDNMTGLRAYHRISGNNYDRVRTGSSGLWTSLGLGYDGLVSVKLAGSPKTVATSVTNNIGDNGGDFIASILATPFRGLSFSAGYALNGNGKGDSEMKKVLRDGTPVSAGGNGILAAAFDLDLGTMLDLPFSIGLSATDRYAFASDAYYDADDKISYASIDGYNTFAAGLYGGAGIVSLGIEYALHTIFPEAGDATNINFLYGEISLDLVQNMGLKFYAGANDLEEIRDTFYLGGTVDYTDRGITYALNVDYACPDGLYSESLANGRTGFSVTPSVSVSF